jgi:3',5'-cyclic AMP phosphodiesterase CpdA
MLAHLSDLHVLAPKRAQGRSLELGIRFVSFGRALDADARRRKVTRALLSASKAGAGHVAITGDLTETGSPEQFEALAELLHDIHIDPERVTLVPGNHDAYTAPDAWKRALEGPLSAFRRGAAEGAGKVIEYGELALLPIDTTFHQMLTRSAGVLSPDAVRAVERRLADPLMRDRPIALLMHHPPIPHGSRAWQWMDGLMGYEPLLALLRRFPNVTVLHGHLHFAAERSVGNDRVQVIGTTATVDDEETVPRVRFYHCGTDSFSRDPDVAAVAA